MKGKIKEIIPNLIRSAKLTRTNREKVQYYERAQGYLERKSFPRKFFKSVYLSLFIITVLESLILFKFNKLMVAIGKKPAPSNQEFRVKNLICKMSLCLTKAT